MQTADKMERAARLAGHLSAAPTSSSAPAPTKRDDDVVIVVALRTAIQKARRGYFKDSLVEDLLSPMIRETVRRSGVDPKAIGDVVVGNVLGDGSFHQTKMRMAALNAGIPDVVPLKLVNRQCSSGLEAIANVADAIRAGQYDVGLACGVESMSSSNFKWGDGQISAKVAQQSEAAKCLIPMGITSENVASRYGITRREQDELAARSHDRAAAAIAGGEFRDEIVPIEVDVKDPKTGETHRVRVDTDGGVRKGTTVESLGKLRAVFKKDGSTTAGNASQVSDGAACVLLARRSAATRLGLPVIGCLRSYAVVGCDPSVMGIGPAVAIPVALRRAGLRTDDVDLYEINEAFASQASYCVRELGVPAAKLNVNGGAISLGHPLGCTGARMTATLLNALKRRKGTYGVVSMCIGSGQGAAAVFTRE